MQWSYLARIDAEFLISGVVGSSHETTPVVVLENKREREPRDELTECPMIDPYNRLNDELLPSRKPLPIPR